MSAVARIAIAGAGTIGVGWAVAFARAGHAVAVYDPDGARLRRLPEELAERLELLAACGLLDERADAVAGRVGAHDQLESAVAEADHVQECAPERLELKRELARRILATAPAHAALASSSSAIVPSELFGGLAGRERCLVAHPANPPYLLPVVELVGAEFTSERSMARVEELLRSAEMAPVRLGREVEGFLLNRLQGALLREAYCLVRDGVAGVEEVDLVVREGLGPRWAITGPFETADLNARGGIAAHAATMGPAYERMGAERGQRDPWTPELVSEVERQRRDLLPLEGWEGRVRWRDRRLARWRGSLRGA